MKLELDQIAEGVFFIVGAPRSGTTLLQAMLSSHSRIVIPPETEFFMAFDPPAPDDSHRAWERYWAAFEDSRKWTDQGLDLAVFRTRSESTDRSARAIFLTLLQMHAERAGKPRCGEKSPHHYRHIERIREALPQARFVNIVRDPRDVVASRLRTPWSTGGVVDHARSWMRAIEAHMQNERTLPRDAYMSIQFESLVKEPESHIRNVCDFLGEPFEAAMLNFHDRKDAGFSEREKQWKDATFSPLSAAAIGRHQETLTNRQIDQVQRICSDMMKGFGYELTAIERSPAWVVTNSIDRMLGR